MEMYLKGQDEKKNVRGNKKQTKMEGKQGERRTVILSVCVKFTVSFCPDLSLFFPDQPTQ